MYMHRLLTYFPCRLSLGNHQPVLRLHDKYPQHHLLESSKSGGRHNLGSRERASPALRKKLAQILTFRTTSAMLRINRSRFFGIFCLTVFIYFLLFTDSGSSSSSDFRTSTEAGLARIRAKQNQLPLRGDLSDEDLTKKTYEELRGILASQSKETLKKDEEGNSIGRDSRQEVFGDTPEEPRRISENTGRRTHAVKESKEVDGEDPLAEGSRVIERPKYPISGDSEKNLQSNGQGSEADSGDTAKDDVREKLAEYLKNPGKSNNSMP